MEMADFSSTESTDFGHRVVLEADMAEPGCLTMGSQELNRQEILGRSWSAS